MAARNGSVRRTYESAHGYWRTPLWQLFDARSLFAPQRLPLAQVGAQVGVWHTPAEHTVDPQSAFAPHGVPSLQGEEDLLLCAAIFLTPAGAPPYTNSQVLRRGPLRASCRRHCLEVPRLARLDGQRRQSW